MLSEILLVSTPEWVAEILEKQNSKAAQEFLDKQGIQQFEETLGMCLSEEVDSSNISTNADV